MTCYLLSPAAQADLDDIWDYSLRQWGLAQTERYLKSIGETVSALANGTRTGRPIHDIRPGYWKCPVGSHILFYQIDDTGGIVVIRILHQRMDLPSKLTDT